MGNMLFRSKKCCYCNSGVSNTVCVVYVISHCKLNNRYVCSLCLLSKIRRYQKSIIRSNNICQIKKK